MHSAHSDEGPFPGGPTTELRREWTDRFQEMRPFVHGLRDRDLQHRIERLALGYLDGRSDLIDHIAPDRPIPASMAHHREAARLHSHARDVLLAGRGSGLNPPVLGDLLARCCRHLDLSRVRAVLVGGPAVAVAGSIAAALALEHGAILVGTHEATKVERLLRRGEQVVIASEFDRSADRDRYRAAALNASADVIELRCGGRDLRPGSDDDADPWPEATLIEADSPFADSIDRATTACGWPRR